MVDFLTQLAEDVAPQLLGWQLMTLIDGKEVGGVIVETEAYNQFDAASHSYRGQTPRTKPMFGPAGYAYVYFTYGMHYCFNIVTGKVGEGSAVLVRALEPTAGVEEMRVRRNGRTNSELTNGPAKLCQALGIDRQLNGHDLTKSPLWLLPSQQAVRPENIVTATRIGISRDTYRLWRFFVAGNQYVSKP